MIPQTYQKVIFRGTHAELIDANLPPIQDDQLLVRSRCSLISPGTERSALTRSWDNAEFRKDPGYALAGDVIGVGGDVDGFSDCDRVISLVNHSSLALVSADPWVTLKIPDGMSYEQATFLPLASVALHAIRRAEISLGEIIVIIGAGIIGQLAIQLAKSHGAEKVIVLDIHDNRLELARGYGADLTINANEVDPVSAVFEATDGKGAPVILEAAGNPEVIPVAFKYAANGGRVICVGALEQPLTVSLHEDFIRRELSLIAAFQPYCPTEESLYWKWTQQANRELLLRLIKSRKLHVDEMLTHYFKASDAQGVYERIKEREPSMIGVVLEWNQEN